MRGFQGRASEELYNQTLTQIHNWLKTLHSTTEPEDAIDGALWIDGANTLRVKHDNQFKPLYQNTYQSMNGLIEQEQPIRPSLGQLWVNESGVLCYYNGIKFTPVKAGEITDFNMDGYEPFVLIDALNAGANQIIKKENNIIEEEFISGDGATEFILQKGQYEPMQNKLIVYINGRILPKSQYLEHNTTTVRLIEPLFKGERVMLQYLHKQAEKNPAYTPLKFHPALREMEVAITKPTYTIDLPINTLLDESMIMLYVNGRFVGNSYYTIDGQVLTIKAQLEKGEKVLVQYIDKLLCDSLPDEEITVTEETPYTQYIWPSSDYDRLFMNGKLNLEYETVNKISIQYPSTAVQGKNVSAVHVHPKNLCEIKKRIIMVDKTTGFIQVDELNTEFYAITNNTIVTEAELKKSTLATNLKDYTTSNQENARSYFMHVRPGATYRIRRSVASGTFTVAEYEDRPQEGISAKFVQDITQVNETGFTYEYTASNSANFVLITVSLEGGEWHAPLATSNVKTPKSILLTKTNKTDTDYISSVGGITLSEYVKNNFEYVLAITYVFSESAGRGSLSKMSFDITDNSQIIIGNIGDPLLVFAQGHYLIQDDNYTYDHNTGLLTLMFPEQLDIGVITFPKYEEGVILEESLQGHAMIFMQKQMTQPLVFIYGEHTQKLVDYEQDGSVLYIKDAKPNMHYAVVDCVDAYGDSMFVGEGETLYDSERELCYVPVVENVAESNAILFVNGLLINKKDIESGKNRLYIKNNTTGGMRYTLLRGDKGRFLHSQTKEANTFATDAGADQALLYIDGNIVGDIEAFGAVHLPEAGYQNEIKGLMHYDAKFGYIVDSWYIYKNDAWLEIMDDAKREELKTHLAHYILENKIVHFTDINTIYNKRCSVWLYKYDETIEYPLMYSWMTMGTATKYKTQPAHGYPINQNALSIYIDGYRQYPEKSNFPNGVKEVNDHEFEIGAPVPGGRLEYIIEMPERNETRSCASEILTSNDVYNQTLKTNIPLLPGFVDLFIDGVRQPKTSYEIIDRYSIVLNNFLKDPRYTNLFLIEVRQDYFLNEATMTIEKDGQTVFECVDKMRSLLFSKDFIKIYVNGIYVAEDYDILREHNTISIPRIDTLGFAKKGHVVSFVWR